MNKEIQAIILAGGRGSRMGDLTSDTQKCMLLVEGKPILAHILDNLSAAFGSADLTIATGYKGESVREYFGSKYRNVDIQYVHDPNRLETKRRLLLAKDLLQKPFLFLSGDVISNPEQLSTVATTFFTDWKNGLMGVLSGAVYHLPAPTHALLTVKEGLVSQLLFPPTESWNSGQLREMGIAFFHQRFINMVKEAEDQMYISQILGGLITRGEGFAGQPYSDKWYHFFKPSDLQATIVFDRKTHNL